MILQKLQFVSLWVWKLTLDQTAVMNLRKLFLFIDIGHFIDKENIMTFVDFACGNIF